ncbi:hypothetical protein [Marinimicrobium agarilyticum]|uniref:hypothetical protein n=1 Tax=Marinimicrobium agarilyticum TaxID=306546 RepID=UPI0004048EDC|nr:hypothetical protein [Marinimicrobium agarilyticum]
MSKPSLLSKPRVDRGLNVFLMLSLLAAGAAFAFHTSGYGLLLAPVAAVIAFGVLVRYRWAYFASGAWCLACYQLAKEGLEFELLKRGVMIASIPLVALSIYLHEAFVPRASSERTPK